MENDPGQERKKGWITVLVCGMIVILAGVFAVSQDRKAENAAQLVVLKEAELSTLRLEIENSQKEAQAVMSQTLTTQTELSDLQASLDYCLNQ